MLLTEKCKSIINVANQGGINLISIRWIKLFSSVQVSATSFYYDQLCEVKNLEYDMEITKDRIILIDTSECDHCSSKIKVKLGLFKHLQNQVCPKKVADRHM